MPYSCLAIYLYTLHVLHLQHGSASGKKRRRKNPLNIMSFWDALTPEPPTYWKEWIIKFHWGMIAKYEIDPDDFYFANTLNAAAIAALSEEVNGKNRIEAEKKLKSNLYLCFGDEAQRIFKARKPTVSIKTERYPGVLDGLQNVFKRERNLTHERGLFYGRKQRENETFEKFHAELSALAGRCDFANAAENIRDIFILNMRVPKCQRELSRSTKLPEEVYRIALSYERGERANKAYPAKPASSAPQISVKQEPVNNIRRGQGYFQDGARGGRGRYTPGASSGGSKNRRCYNCDAPNFTLDHIANCPAKGATCNAYRKLGHFDVWALEEELTSGEDEGE